MVVSYAVIFERAESNWAAYVPDLPGCISTGCHIQTLREFGEPVPEPSTIVSQVAVELAA